MKNEWGETRRRRHGRRAYVTYRQTHTAVHMAAPSIQAVAQTAERCRETGGGVKVANRERRREVARKRAVVEQSAGGYTRVARQRREANGANSATVYSCAPCYALRVVVHRYKRRRKERYARER